jgi:DNA-binding NtrC family response regulator
MEIEKKKILIVDDEEDLTWSISKRLAKDGNHFKVMCANSGKKALDLLSKFRYDLLVTDLRMPGIDGWQILDEIKTNYPDTLVIVMTAHGSVEVIDALNRWGRTGYIEKPFEMNDLRKLIYAFLKEKMNVVEN